MWANKIGVWDNIRQYTSTNIRISLFLLLFLLSVVTLFLSKVNKHLKTIQTRTVRCMC